MIEVKNLNFTYPKATKPTLPGLNFDIERGELFGFLGPSGAGKSTTQKILIGLLKNYEGFVSVFGKNLTDWKSDYYERIGVSFEFPNHFLKLTALENLTYFSRLYSGPTEAPHTLLEWLGLADAGQMPVSQYSKGMKNRLSLTRALLHCPQLLFLDEPERRKRGHTPEPSVGVIDSQSVKTTEAGGQRGYDAGKQVKGRKRHVVVDTVGNLLEVVVHAANIQDYDGAKLVLTKLSQSVSTFKKLWADGMYKKNGLVHWVHDSLKITLEIIEREPDQIGFKVLPQRWVVERAFAWLGRYRRLSKDYEKCTKSSEAMLYLASIHTRLKRLSPG